MADVDAKVCDLVALEGVESSADPFGQGGEPPPDPASWNLPATLNVQQDGSVDVRQYANDATGWTISVTNLPTGVTYNSGTEELEGAASGTASGTATFTLSLVGQADVVDTATVALVESVYGAYTPTHYVTSDAPETISQAAYNAAASEGSPCSLQCAMQYAVAGDVVQVGAGVYSGEKGSTSDIPVFSPANNGELGSPIVFVAENPAADNYGASSVYSELRVSNQVTTPYFTYYTGPVIGARGSSLSSPRSHIIFDGFYINFLYAFPFPSKGAANAWFSNNIGFRRFAFDASNPVGVGDQDNFNSIFIQNSENVSVSDCVFNGTAGDGNNNAHVEAYGVSPFTVEHCEFNDVSCAVFSKGVRVSSPETVHLIKYNKIDGASKCAIVTNAMDSPSVIHNNLLLNMSSRGIEWNNSSSESTKTTYVYNNTVLLSGESSSSEPGNESGIRVTSGEGVRSAASRFYNNIVSGEAGNSLELVSDNNSSGIEDWSLWDHNFYYNPSQSLLGFYKNYSRSTSLSAWQSAVAPAESNSVYGDPLFVGGNDYRLQAGSPALTASNSGGPVGCYVTGQETIGRRG